MILDLVLSSNNTRPFFGLTCKEQMTEPILLALMNMHVSNGRRVGNIYITHCAAERFTCVGLAGSFVSMS